MGKVKGKKKKAKVFRELKKALADALAYENGREMNLRVSQLPPPPKALRPAEIRAIRRALNATQERFAEYLNVSTNTVQSWEQGLRRPQFAALKLLAIVKKRPRALLEA